MFAVREALSRPDELKKVVGELIARGEVDAGRRGRRRSARLPRRRAPSVVEAAYRFCRHEPGAHVILTGTGDPEHLKANVAAIQAPPLPPEVLTRLDAIFGGWTASRATERCGAEKRRRSSYIGRRTRVGERRSLLTGCCQSRA